MNANLYHLYTKHLREADEQPAEQQQPEEKKGLLQRGKEAVGNFAKKHGGKLLAAGALAAGAAGVLSGNKEKLTPEQIQQQNMELQQQLDNNLKMDVMSLMHKAQTGNTPYSKRIFIATQPLSDNANQVDPRKQPKIKKEGGLIDTVKGFVGL
jgi:hypothetical protein